jgi:hypothetical protein
VRIVEHNNQLLVSAVLGAFGDECACDAVLERVLIALEGAVCEANTEHAGAIANQMYWSEMTREEEIAQGWPEDCGEQFAEVWGRTVAQRRRALGRVLSLQHEIQKFMI